MAPVAGHVDHHGGPEEAARVEVAEEVGLHVIHPDLVLTGWRSNRCRRPATDSVGHRWWIYQALESASSAHPTGRCAHPDGQTTGQLQQLASRTTACARGKVSEDEFTTSQG
jgi:ADP-ribose pyrophosphatase YjhB (NUDIX family)